MGIVKKIVLICVCGVFAAGWAMGQPVPRGPDQETVGQRPSGRMNERAKKAKEMEASLLALQAEVDRLREEVAVLTERLKTLQGRSPAASFNFKLPSDVILCGERVPVEDRRVWENLDREFLLAIHSEAQVLLWMKRARRYFPAIEKRLKEMGLPEDLKYVTITESSLRPMAVSSSGAAGIWQFIPSTGEKYGMRKNKSLDERFDFFKATEGALAYLKSLYSEFGSWSLAMAAYNAGENRVRKEVEFQKTADYYRLFLPTETERYVYKIAVAKIILSSPERYGFRLEEGELYDPLRLDRIQIELTQALPLMDVARAVGAYYKEIKEMNPHLSEENVPAGAHSLNLPPGTSERFWTFYAAWKKGTEAR